MNPFQKLKLTIDRVGLQYIPSNDYEKISGQTVYKYSKNPQNGHNYHQPENQSLPYFKTQGPNQSVFKQRSSIFMNEEIEELRTVYENQQKNLVQEITALNKKIQTLEKTYTAKESQNQNLKMSLSSLQRQNVQLRAFIYEIQQKSATKLSQSGVHDRERKLRQEIDRINSTVAELATDLNSQRANRKSMHKQLQNSKSILLKSQQNMAHQKNRLEKSIQLLQQELEKRAELLEHSIRTSRDQKVNHRKQLAQLKQRHEHKLQSVKLQLDRARQDIYGQKDESSQLRYTKQSLTKQLQQVKQLYQQTKMQIQTLKSEIASSVRSQKSLNDKISEYTLQIAYLNQQLADQRSNAKVKVVQIRDQSLQMELMMYKKQCKQLQKQRNIWDSVRKDKSDYTIVSQSQILIAKSD